MKKKFNEFIKKSKIFCEKHKEIIFLILPFLWLDFSLQLIGSEISYFPLFILMPLIFNGIWIFLILSICLNLNPKTSKIIYAIFLAVFLIIFITNGVYYSSTGNFFDFQLLELSYEAKNYIWDSILNTKIFIYFSLIIFIILTYYAYQNYPKTKRSIKAIGLSIISFILVHAIIPIFYGFPNKTLKWNTWQNAQNVYLNFNDCNKSFSITGLYEYSVRNFYITFIKKENISNESELEYLQNTYYDVHLNDENAYTNLFKDNNVIFVQLEGIDDFLVTNETMPNLYGLLDNSINFTNHYSHYNGGGSTFNSEFAVNTGFITPITYNRNAYNFNKNDFYYSMANLFKNEKYIVNAFHMNSSEYYSRGINYEDWGYDNYYSLKDMNVYFNNAYEYDTELIKNQEFYDLMFKQEGKFVDYIITYSNHMPFSTKSGVCKQLLNEDLSKKLITKQDIQNYTEEDCIKRQAKETDDFVGLLIQALEDNNLSENTVVIFFTDHYLYTVSDKSILDQYKDTNNNLINKTPFFIYKKNLKKVNITDVTSQIDILPTTLNLFGIPFIKEYYIGSDALDGKYEGITFFSDYSWYDGKCYVENNSVTNECFIDEITLSEKNDYIFNKIKKNDLTLKYNYFKKINENEENTN